MPGARLTELAETVSDAGICPAPGDTLNQVLPEDVAAVACHTVPPVPPIWIDCDCAGAPCGIWKFSAAEATERLAVDADTVRPTLTVSCDGDASGFEIVMLPV